MTESSFIALKYQLVERLLDAGMGRRGTRTLVVRELETALGADLTIARSAVARHDVLSIVNGALAHPGGLQTLAELIGLLVGNGSGTRTVLELIKRIDQRMRDSDGPVSATESAAPTLSQSPAMPPMSTST